MTTPIQPTAVYAPGQPYGGRAGGGTPPPPQYQQPIQVPPQRSRTGAVYNRIMTTGTPQRRQLDVPSGVPAILGNRNLLITMWFLGMVLIGLDEYSNYKVILPRPVRFWRGSFVYAGLGLLSFSDPMVPLANAFAVGYTFVLAYRVLGQLGAAQSGQQQGTPATGGGGGTGGVKAA